MASRSVSLVNRLRLGEAPSAADCALAARLLDVEGAASDVLDLHDDLVKTAAGDAGARKIRVRVALVAETARVLEAAAEAGLAALAHYFSSRAEVEHDDGAGDDPDPEGEVEQIGEQEQVIDLSDGGQGAAALADLAVPARVGEAFDAALAALADDCRRIQDGMAALLAQEPDIDASLDFLSSLEADLQHALYAVLRPDFSDGETPYRAGLTEVAALALQSQSQ
jgi:hypothetical protein